MALLVAIYALLFLCVRAETYVIEPTFEDVRTVLEDVWLVGSTMYVKRFPLTNFTDLHFHGFDVKKFENAAVDGLAQKMGGILVINKPLTKAEVWYHSLYDNTLPGVKAILDVGVENVSASKVTVVFASQKTPGNVPLYKTLEDLWHLLGYKHIYLSVPDFLQSMFGNTAVATTSNNRTFDQSEREKVVWYYTKAVLVGNGEIPSPESYSKRNQYETALRFIKGKVELASTTTDDSFGDLKDGLRELPPVIDVLFLDRGSTTKARRFLNHADDIKAAIQNVTSSYMIHEIGRSDGILKQFQLFHNAKVLVAAHGSGLSNIIWMRPGASIIEIFPYKWQYDLYKSWAEALGIRYFHLWSNSTDAAHEPGHAMSDYGPTCQNMAEVCRNALSQGLGNSDELLKDGAAYTCCFFFWRDHHITVNTIELQNTLLKALDESYIPNCNYYYNQKWEGASWNSAKYECEKKRRLHELQK